MLFPHDTVSFFVGTYSFLFRSMVQFPFPASSYIPFSVRVHFNDFLEALCTQGLFLKYFFYINSPPFSLDFAAEYVYSDSYIFPASKLNVHIIIGMEPVYKSQEKLIVIYNF